MLSRLEQIYDAAFAFIEGVIGNAVTAFTDYVERIGRFTIRMLTITAKLVWQLIRLGASALAPCYIASFGYELTQAAFVRVVLWFIGLFMVLLGLAGLMLLVFALLVGLFETQRRNITRPRSSIQILWLIDVAGICAVLIWMLAEPSHRFHATLLVATRNVLSVLF